MADQPVLAEPRDEAREIITSGSISRAVWFVAWPTVVNTLIQTAYNIINRIFVGHLGHDAASALAAVGIAGVVLMIQFAVMFGIAAGASALISRFLGAKEYDDAREATGQALGLAFLAAIVSGAPLVILATPIARLMGAKAEVIPLTAGYMAIIGCFSVPMFLYMVTTSALRSAGNVRSALCAGAVVIGLNVLLDWLLIFGVGPFPALGVRGAAIATGVSRTAGTFVILWFLHRSVLGGALAHIRPHLAWFGRIMNIGWPACLQNLLWSTSFAAYVKVLGALPDATVAQAALTVGVTIEATAFMPGAAYSIAATPLVGQNLGAGQPKRAEHAAWVATGQAVAVMTLVAMLFIFIPAQLAHIFTRDRAVVALIVTYLRINAISEPLLAVGMVLAGALQGAGDTRFPTWAELIVGWFCRVPLACLLGYTLGYGANGAWVAMSATTCLYGILMAWWFRRGKWRTQKV